MMRALLHYLSLTLAIVTTLAPSAAAAAAQPAFYLIGDCVEYDTSHYNPALRWRKGRVSEIDDYFITIEPEQRTNDLPVRVAAGAAAKWMRFAKGCAAADGATDVPDGVPQPDLGAPDANPEPPPPPPPPLAGRFRVGDCIEYDTSNRFRPELRWQKGRITDIDEYFVTISIDGVEFDPDMPTRVATMQVARWLRPAKGCIPLKPGPLAHAGGPRVMFASFQSAPAALPANVPAKPVAELECPLVQAKVSPKPDQAVLANVIRCLFEKDTDIESVRAHVDSQKIGQSRGWDPIDDLGNGKMGTTVFPVRADWRLIRYYRDSIQVSAHVSVFNCFVNAFDEWECGLASRIREGSVVTYRRPR